MKKFRVAICFRGLIRTGIENRKTFSHYFESLGWDIDYFCHTWNYENVAPPFLESPTAGSDLWNELKERPTSTLTTFKVSKFTQIYDFKKFKLQDITDYRNLDSKNVNYPNDEFVMHFHPQFISCYEVNKLKSEYENENNFKYDLVINTRPDIVFNPMLIDNTIEDMKSILNNPKNYFGISSLQSGWTYEDNFFDDICYTAGSDNMNLFCEYYNPSTNLEYHNFIGKYAKKVGLEIVNVDTGYAILRNYLSFFCPIEEFDEIFIGNLLLYFAPDLIEEILKANKHLTNAYENAYRNIV